MADDIRIIKGYRVKRHPDGRLETLGPANGPQPVTMGRPAPTAPLEVPKMQGEINKTETDIVDTREDNRRADLQLEAELFQKGLRIGPNGSIEDIPGWKPRESDKPATVIEQENKAEGKRDKARVVRSIMSEVLDLYKEDLEGQPISRAFGAAEKIDSLPRNERFTETAQGMLALIRPMVAMGAKDGDSDKEMAVFLSYIPSADDSDLTIESKFRNLERLLTGVAEGKKPTEAAENLSYDIPTPFVDGKLGKDRTGVPVVGPRIPGFSPSGGPAMQAADETYSTPQDLAVAKAVQEVYNRGGSVRDMAAAARDMGYPVNLQHAQQWARAIDYRDAKGEYEGQRTGFATVTPPQSGKRSLAGQVFGDFARDDIGAMAVGAGIGAANAASFGGIDEITGGINSVIRGTDAGDEIAYANMGKQAAFDNAPGSALFGEVVGGVGLGGLTAKAFPKALEVLAGSGRRALGTGAVLGGVTGAIETNENRLGGAIGGAALGAGGGVLGQKVIGPAAEAIASSGPMQALSQKARAFANTIRPGTTAPSALPMLPTGQRAAAGMMGDEIGEVRARLSEAEGLGLPYALADASPELRSLAGSAARKSQNARALAENTFDPRHMDQGSRAYTAIEQNLAAPVDPVIRGKQLLDAGNLAARPHYNMANAQGVPYDENIAAYLNTETGRNALKEARRIAENEGRNPDDLGFVMDEGGNVGLAGFDQAGRYSRVPVGNPMDELRSGKVAGRTADVNTRGPLDLVGWLRQNGGLRDSGGELRHMGVTNKGREGFKMVGQEARFGPLLADDGMDFDDAALAAWEAGYFPELSERPSINQFLDAFRDTYDGFDRRFLLDDQPEIDRFLAAEEQAARAREARFEGSGLWTDDSTPAGPRQFPPDEAYGRVVKLPSFETLDLVKKGIDAQVYNPANTNPMTGEVNLRSPAVRSLEQFRKGFVSALDELNPSYPNARAAYAPYAKAKEALELGLKGPAPRVRPRDVERVTSGLTQESLDEYRTGYATGLGDMVGNTADVSDPYKRIYGASSQREKIGQVFPEGAERFGRIYDLERDMAQTRYETLGGSPTAARMAADDQFGGRALEIGADAAADIMATGGALTLGNMFQIGARNLRDASRLGIGKRAAAKADALAPMLYETDPGMALKQLDEIENYVTARNARKMKAKRRGGLFGATAPIVLVPSE